MNVERIVRECWSRLPGDWKGRPWTLLNHGKDILDNELKLNAYMAAYGEMHVVKCRLAMKGFPFDDFALARNDSGEVTHMPGIEIYDWGCGQGIGSLVFLQMLHERGMLHGVRRVTLVEPSSTALARARGWVAQAAPAACEVRVRNRAIPSNEAPLWTDAGCREQVAVHIFSNILDLREVGLKWLARMVSGPAAPSGPTAGPGYCICVGPRFGGMVSRIVDFHNCLGKPECFSDFTQYPCAYTCNTNHPFGIEAKCFKLTASDRADENYREMSDQRHVDEYHCGDECLKGVLPEAVISAFHALGRAAREHGFKLFLRPTIGVERPDFLLLHKDHGAVIVDVCPDLKQFNEALHRVNLIKEAVFSRVRDLEIDTLVNSSFYNTVKIGLFFGCATDKDVQNACKDHYEEILETWKKREIERRGTYENDKGEKEAMPPFPPAPMPKDPTQFLVKLNAQNLNAELGGVRCKFFKPEHYAGLEEALLGNWHGYAQGDLTLKLTKRQRELVENDDERLRIRGVAGSGKTQIVAHKAVREHIRTGEKVLVLTFNITLINYIRMRINQVPADFSTNAFDFDNYHHFFMAKARAYYGERLGRHIPFGSSDNPNFFDPYIEKIKRDGDQYATILIDEVQDYKSEWLDIVRSYFLREGGKMILFGDGAQNIYGREVEATSRLPRVKGFPKPWRNVSGRISMRMLNPGIAALCSGFAREFGLPGSGLTVPADLNLFDFKMGYWNVTPAASPESLAANIEWILRQYGLDAGKVVVLAQSIHLLREVDWNLRMGFGRKTIRTFESHEIYEVIRRKGLSAAEMMLRKGRREDVATAELILGKVRREDLATGELVLRKVRRATKVHFTTGSTELNVATIQSFKGWEAQTVILVIQSEKDGKPDCSKSEEAFVLQSIPNIPAHVYTALTRARENLFILNMGNDTYHDFFQSNIQND